MRQTFDILFDVDNLLQILILSIVENGIVDDDSVYAIVLVCGNDGLFYVILPDGANSVLKSTTDMSISWTQARLLADILFLTRSAGPVCIDLCGRIVVCKDSQQMRLRCEFRETLFDFTKQTSSDHSGQNGLAGCL